MWQGWGGRLSVHTLEDYWPYLVPILQLLRLFLNQLPSSHSPPVTRYEKWFLKLIALRSGEDPTSYQRAKPSGSEFTAVRRAVNGCKFIVLGLSVHLSCSTESANRLRNWGAKSTCCTYSSEKEKKNDKKTRGRFARDRYDSYKACFSSALPKAHVRWGLVPFADVNQPCYRIEENIKLRRSCGNPSPSSPKKNEL